MTTPRDRRKAIQEHLAQNRQRAVEMGLLRDGTDRPMTFLAPFIYNATVAKVVDGDSVDVVLDWGFHRYEDVSVRLLGCNAIELAQPGGKEARDHLAALLPVGAPVALRTAKPDKYAPRWDAAVTYLGTDHTVRDLVPDLIADGWAAPWTGQGPRPVPPWPRSAA